MFFAISVAGQAAAEFEDFLKCGVFTGEETNRSKAIRLASCESGIRESVLSLSGE